MRLRTSFLVVTLAACVPFAWAGTPDWLRAAAHETLPAYKADTDGVVILHEEITSVDASGEIYTVYREAVKILRPNRRESLSRVLVPFDNETKLTWLKGWAITAGGQEYEVKEKDAVETNALSSSFVSDSRIKVLIIPGGEVGSVIGYEYQQRRRPSIYEDIWGFQGDLPVHLSRYTLHLPAGWEYETFWNNHDKIQPTIAGNDTTWQVSDQPGIEEEDYMPPRRAIAGRMLLHYFGPNTNHASGPNWSRVGSWYSQLVSDRRVASPEIKKEVQTITASAPTPLEKVALLAYWVQKEIRYVAVEVGIGGYQPHTAGDIYRGRYGDCKDKVTLLSTMLSEVGVESYYVLIHSVRGVVMQDSPSAVTFNHVILAIRAPKDAPIDKLKSVYNHPQLGPLILFDPTDDMTPFGYLPATLQATNALLVANGQGELIRMPLLAPGSNQLRREGRLVLTSDGSLSGQVEEWRTGIVGRDFRERLLVAESKDRAKSIEQMLSSTLASFQLTKAEVGSLDAINEPLFVRYNFSAPEYAKKAGQLLLVRPRVLGQKNWTIMEGNKRLYPVEYDSASLQSDLFEIAIPEGYEVDELPDPVDLTYDFGEYHSKIQQSGKSLKYSRTFTIKQVIVPTARLDDLKKFYRSIASDERNTAVLKPKAASSGN